MGHVQRGRFTADASSLGDGVVVFLIGMRINKPWKVGVWWPVLVAMPKMLNYLAKQPDKGLLGYEQAFLPSPMIVQYWRSFEDLARFARNPDDPHLEPWRQFNRRWESQATSGSGTGPIESARRTSRRSTATCRPVDWLRRAPSS